MAYTKTQWVNNVTPINASNMNKIEEELEALDIELTEAESVIEGVSGVVSGHTEDIADLQSGKLSATKSAISNVGGIVIPSATLTAKEIVGVDEEGNQIRIQLGDGVELVGDTSPYLLKATTGRTYKHLVRLQAHWEDENIDPNECDITFVIYSSSSASITSMVDLINKCNGCRVYGKVIIGEGYPTNMIGYATPYLEQKIVLKGSLLENWDAVDPQSYFELDIPRYPSEEPTITDSKIII